MPSLRSISSATLPAVSAGHAAEYDILLQVSACAIRRVLSALLPPSVVKQRVEAGFRQAPAIARAALQNNQLDIVEFFAGNFTVSFDPGNESIRVSLPFTAFFPRAGASPLKGTISAQLDLDIDSRNNRQIMLRCGQVDGDRINLNLARPRWFNDNRRRVLGAAISAAVVLELQNLGDLPIGPGLNLLPWSLFGQSLHKAHLGFVPTSNEETSVLSLAFSLRDYDEEIFDIMRPRAEHHLRQSYERLAGWQNGQTRSQPGTGSKLTSAEVRVDSLLDLKLHEGKKSDNVYLLVRFSATARFVFKLSGNRSWRYDHSFSFSSETPIQTRSGKVVAVWNAAEVKYSHQRAGRLSAEKTAALKDAFKFAEGMIQSGFKPRQQTLITRDRKITDHLYVFVIENGRKVIRVFFDDDSIPDKPGRLTGLAKRRATRYSVGPGAMHGPLPPFAQDVVGYIEDRTLSGIIFEEVHRFINLIEARNKYDDLSFLKRAFLNEEFIRITRFVVNMRNNNVAVAGTGRFLDSGNTATVDGSIKVDYFPHRYKQHFEATTRLAFTHPDLDLYWGLAILAVIAIPFGAGSAVLAGVDSLVSTRLSSVNRDIARSIIRELQNAKDLIESQAFDIEPNITQGRLKLQDAEVNQGALFRLNLDIWQTRPNGMALVGKRYERINGRWTLYAYQLESGALVRISDLITALEQGDTIRGVHLVKRGSSRWLRSDPDSNPLNNLSALPEV